MVSLWDKLQTILMKAYIMCYEIVQYMQKMAW
jgi:hypothetical protein